MSRSEIVSERKAMGRDNPKQKKKGGRLDGRSVGWVVKPEKRERERES